MTTSTCFSLVMTTPQDEQDMEILLNPAGELTDSIIDGAQTLLKQAIPQLCGLQSVSCGLTMTFDIEPSEFVQVLNNGMGHCMVDNLHNWHHPSFRTYLRQHVPLSRH